MTMNLLSHLTFFQEPRPCLCGCRTIWTCYVGGGYEGLLPFWVRMKCPVCGRQTQKKLFRTRAVRAWNKSLRRCNQW